MKFWYTTITFILVCNILAKCQPIFSDFENIGVDEGLSQSSVFALYQDKEGFIWIGTGDGLNRYDGKQIKTYKAPVDLSTTSNSNLIRGNLAEDCNGNIWYTTENGLYVLDKSIDAIQKKYSFIN